MKFTKMQGGRERFHRSGQPVRRNTRERILRSRRLSLPPPSLDRRGRADDRPPRAGHRRLRHAVLQFRRLTRRNVRQGRAVHRALLAMTAVSPGHPAHRNDRRDRRRAAHRRGSLLRPAERPDLHGDGDRHSVGRADSLGIVSGARRSRYPARRSGAAGMGHDARRTSCARLVLISAAMPHSRRARM